MLEVKTPILKLPQPKIPRWIFVALGVCSLGFFIGIFLLREMLVPTSVSFSGVRNELGNGNIWELVLDPGSNDKMMLPSGARAYWKEEEGDGKNWQECVFQEMRKGNGVSGIASSLLVSENQKGEPEANRESSRVQIVIENGSQSLWNFLWQK